MCRLLGMSGGSRRVRATFWLLDAPDSLSAQSRQNPDGTGLGVFDADGTPQIYKEPVAAFEDRDFSQHARTVESTTFVAHVRHASTGSVDARNTHPFVQRGRLFAHNGVVEDLDTLDAHLGDDLALVGGDTDSERYFALITREIDAHGGDVTAGITAAARWMASNIALYCLNMILTTPDGLWALCYPDTNTLYVLAREAGGPHGSRPLEHVDAAGETRVRSPDLGEVPSIVVASEPMDEHADWRQMRPGELLHVGPRLGVTSHIALPDLPGHMVSLGDLHPQAAASQAVG